MFTYKAPQVVRDIFDRVTDDAIRSVLDNLANTPPKPNGAVDMNAIFHRVVPVTVTLFILDCPEEDLVAMSRELKRVQKAIKG